MISKVSERTMHYLRWVLAIFWLVLIASLFSAPISQHLSDLNHCVKVQGDCLLEKPYSLGSRIFWGMVVPSAIAIVFVLGHETWRRICPLYFFSQIPRALGLRPRLKIRRNQWLQQNHFYLQFFLLFVGLNLRILFLNSHRIIFGLFLLLTILAAIFVVWLYGGRSWCHYVCPFGMVQTVFTGPRGLLGSQAHQTRQKTITQSMCRTVDSQNNREIVTCINCKSACLDIDSEKSYWSDLQKPGRKLVQYGYLGLVIGYFAYYYLYAGNFDYYFSGAWIQEEDLRVSLLQPGFYWLNRPIPIPKLVAVPLTLAFFVIVSCLICRSGEKTLFSYFRQNNHNLNRQQLQHRCFTLCTFIAFNTFFVYGGRPEILRFPLLIHWLFNALVILVSTLWLYRTWHCSFESYNQERLASKLRRQLKKLTVNWSSLLKGRSLDRLKPNEIFTLAQVLPDVLQQNR